MRRPPPAVLARARARARTAAARALIDAHRDLYAAEYEQHLAHQLAALGEIPGQLALAALVAEEMSA